MTFLKKSSFGEFGEVMAARVDDELLKSGRNKNTTKTQDMLLEKFGGIYSKSFA